MTRTEYERKVKEAMDNTPEEFVLCDWTRSLAENLAIKEEEAKKTMIYTWIISESQESNLIDLFNEVRSLYLDLEED